MLADAKGKVSEVTGCKDDSIVTLWQTPISREACSYILGLIIRKLHSYTGHSMINWWKGSTCNGKYLIIDMLARWHNARGKHLENDCKDESHAYVPVLAKHACSKPGRWPKFLTRSCNTAFKREGKLTMQWSATSFAVSGELVNVIMISGPLSHNQSNVSQK